MRRSSERLIDVVVLIALLMFAFLMRGQDPALAGVIVAAGIQFWMTKNATEPHSTTEEAAARAAAAVLEVAREEQRSRMSIVEDK